MHSASVTLRETIGCFLKDQDMRLLPKNMHYLLVDRIVSCNGRGVGITLHMLIPTMASSLFLQLAHTLWQPRVP
ncbi:unnamed protein product [Cochlearia groenlandica]